MADIIIDLSGKKGLGDNFFGDTDMVTPRPELRMEDETGMASGLFSPHLRNGYMAPITTTSVTYTSDVTPSSQLIASEYDFTNEDVYWADNVKSIFVASSTLTDTSLVRAGTLDPSSLGYSSLYDLQLYQINGVQRLFYVGKGVPTDITTEISVASQSVTDQYATAIVAFKPSASTQPSIVSTGRLAETASTTTQTLSFTVPSGTDQVLTVIVYNIGATGPTSCTFGGVAMTLGSSTGYTTSEPGYSVYTLINPTVSTANIVTTWGSAVVNRCTQAILTSNTHQTTPSSMYGSVGTTANSTGTIKTSLNPIHVNQLTIVSYYSDTSATIDSYLRVETEYYKTTWTYGEDYLAVVNLNNCLLVGHSAIPSPAFTATTTTFSTYINTPGAFLQYLPGDYAFMRTADNGFAYVFASNAVHKIDGSFTGGVRGTLTKNVLLFPEGFRVTDALDYRSNLYLAVHQYSVNVQTTSLNNYTGRCGIYVWNRISTQLSSADYIELPGVREIKKIYASPDGLVKLITISDNGTTELREFGYNDSGGVVFPVKKRLGIGAFPQVPDGLSSAGDKVTWVANDGNIYIEKGNAVTKLFVMKAAGTGTAGLMSNVTTGALLYGSGVETATSAFRTNKQGISFSYLDSATPYIKKIYPFDLTTGADAAQTPSQGDVYTGVKLIPIGSNVRGIRVYNAPITGSGTDVIATVKLYFNQSTTATLPSGMTKSITKDEAKRGYVDFKINSHNIHAVQVEVEWSTSVTLGADTYLPSMAIVTYDETTSKSPDSE